MKRFDYGKSAADLRNRIRAMWEQGLDTTDMAQALQLPEHEIERQLHIALDRRRAVVGNLGAVGDRESAATSKAGA